VAQHLRAWIAYSGRDIRLNFWRTRAGAEVYFVAYGPDGFWAIEVKNTRRVRPEDLRGLRSFQKESPEAERIFLYRGEERLQTGGVLCLPAEALLRELHPGQDLV
jgi:hypothetical protein